MADPPSPHQYFQALMRQRGDLSVLERKVAAPYSVMQEASVFVANAAISNGIGSIEGYLPLLHTALIDLMGFEVSLVMAGSYGAYTWPNVELRDFAHSIVELGINMKLDIQVTSQNMPALTIHNTGVALQSLGLLLANVASSTYFCQKDVSAIVAANRPSFELSANIVAGLMVEALSCSFGNGTGQADLKHLRSVMGAYVESHAHYNPRKRQSGNWNNGAKQ